MGEREPARSRGAARLGVAALLGAAAIACDAATSPAGAGAPAADVTDRREKFSHTPRWALEPWVSKDISNAADTYAFVDGFLQRGIPVGAVVLDSPWETNYNTFTANPARYPALDRLVADMHGRDVRVVLWITNLINTVSFDFERGGDAYAGPSPNFQEALDRGFFTNRGQAYVWWKGFGANLDFFNPEAVAWWHAQQDPLYELPIDGWKADFGEEWIQVDAHETAQGVKTRQEYSEAYYRDFYEYGRSKRPDDFVLMARPYDRSYGWPGRFFARREHAQVGWVGDNRRDWVGLADALDHLFRSARAGYVVIGSDVGGYLDLNDENLAEPVPFDQETFVRWVAVGALTPFMQLHGRANLEPWSVPVRPEETVAIYRYWATLHHELVPFFYSLAEDAYAGGAPIIRPVGDEGEWPGDYRFLVGDALLVAPVLGPGGARDVALPAGARWYDWWSPGADALAGGQTLGALDASDRQRIPLFVREGAIVPLNVSTDVTGLGGAASAGRLTLLVYPAEGGSTFVLQDADGGLTRVDAARVDGASVVTLSRCPRPLVTVVRVEAEPGAVTAAGAALPRRRDRAEFDAAPAGYYFDGPSRRLWVRVEASLGPLTIEARP